MVRILRECGVGFTGAVSRKTKRPSSLFLSKGCRRSSSSNHSSSSCGESCDGPSTAMAVCKHNKNKTGLNKLRMIDVSLLNNLSKTPLLLFINTLCQQQFHRTDYLWQVLTLGFDIGVGIALDQKQRHLLVRQGAGKGNAFSIGNHGIATAV